MNETHCSDEAPTSEEMIQVIRSRNDIWISVLIGGILSILTVLLFIEIVYNITRRQFYSASRTIIIVLLAIYPVSSVTSFMGVIIPRASLVANLTASFYYCICLYLFVVLVIDYYDGVDCMQDKLKGRHISLARPPIACCCFCLPRIEMTRNNFHNLRLGILQNAIVRPASLFIAATLWADGTTKAVEAYLYINAITMISSVFAVYSLAVIYNASKIPLKDFMITPKFIAMKLVMLVGNTQHFILSLLAYIEVILPCNPPLNTQTRANTIYNMLITYETFIMLLLGRIFIYIWREKQQSSSESLDRMTEAVAITETKTCCNQKVGLSKSQENCAMIEIPPEETPENKLGC
ncbi:organic solute transporter subunit alpha-like [Anneissia japonica]|uniref:organic solute transporter subunit alpha-like n=1 Tax=Anneissia japonica TaxID=1529436 RepID=UPI00142596EE|nr:organic solute transporter subunit alpha-like [Anneissia japonica]